MSGYQIWSHEQSWIVKDCRFCMNLFCDNSLTIQLKHRRIRVLDIFLSTLRFSLPHRYYIYFLNEMDNAADLQIKAKIIKWVSFYIILFHFELVNRLGIVKCNDETPALSCDPKMIFTFRRARLNVVYVVRVRFMFRGRGHRDRIPRIFHYGRVVVRRLIGCFDQVIGRAMERRLPFLQGEDRLFSDRLVLRPATFLDDGEDERFHTANVT